MAQNGRPSPATQGAIGGYPEAARKLRELHDRPSERSARPAHGRGVAGGALVEGSGAASAAGTNLRIVPPMDTR